MIPDTESFFMWLEELLGFDARWIIELVCLLALLAFVVLVFLIIGGAF